MKAREEAVHRRREQPRLLDGQSNRERRNDLPLLLREQADGDPHGPVEVPLLDKEDYYGNLVPRAGRCSSTCASTRSRVTTARFLRPSAAEGLVALPADDVLMATPAIAGGIPSGPGRQLLRPVEPRRGLHEQGRAITVQRDAQTSGRERRSLPCPHLGHRASETPRAGCGASGPTTPSRGWQVSTCSDGGYVRNRDGNREGECPLLRALTTPS